MQPRLRDPPIRAHVNPLHVPPVFNLEGRVFLQRLENPAELDRGRLRAAALFRRLDPRRVLLELEDRAGHGNDQERNGDDGGRPVVDLSVEDVIFHGKRMLWGGADYYQDS